MRHCGLPPRRSPSLKGRSATMSVKEATGNVAIGYVVGLGYARAPTSWNLDPLRPLATRKHRHKRHIRHSRRESPGLGKTAQPSV
jgi:hypothetical protein